jgi:hypothetical protein
MPQYPLQANTALTPGNVPTSEHLDAAGLLLTSSGGELATYNVTAAAIIKASPGRLCKIVVIAPGTTSGALTVNNLTTTSGGAAANQIISIAYGSLTVGQVITLDWPCSVGIAVTAVPGGGSPQYNISYA